MLDEPFTGIDPVTIDSIQTIIRDLRDRGIAILITDHQVRETLEITDRSYVIRAGQVRALVVSTPARVADLPDVPTLSEAGLKDADSAIWFGVLMPSKTPRDIVEKFHAAGLKVLNDPAMQDSLNKLGVEALPMTPSQMDDFVARETVANRAVIEAAGIKQ